MKEEIKVIQNNFSFWFITEREMYMQIADLLTRDESMSSVADEMHNALADLDNSMYHIANAILEAIDVNDYDIEHDRLSKSVLSSLCKAITFGI